MKDLMCISSGLMSIFWASIFFFISVLALASYLPDIVEIAMPEFYLSSDLVAKYYLLILWL